MSCAYVTSACIHSLYSLSGRWAVLADAHHFQSRCVHQCTNPDWVQSPDALQLPAGGKGTAALLLCLAMGAIYQQAPIRAKPTAGIPGGEKGVLLPK